jgi:hypothetical protein
MPHLHKVIFVAKSASSRSFAARARSLLRDKRLDPQGDRSMLRLTTVVLATSLSLAAIAAEEPSAPVGAQAQVVALNSTRAVDAARPVSLDDYAGVYQTADGALFVVARAGDSLVVELPETMALPIRAADNVSFVLDGPVVRLAFEIADGEARMIVSRPSAPPVVATRVALPRGFVTIQDI